LCKEAEGVGFCVAEICHRRRVGKLTPGFGSANSQRPTPGQRIAESAGVHPNAA
jgi:hypothetical protein